MGKVKKMKKIVKYLINKVGYDLKKIHSEEKQIDFDDLLKDKVSKNPLIIDVGGNKGKSIEKYLKIFDQPIIHSFEPIETDFEYMHDKFNKNENIILNNFALGDKIEEKNFNITINSGNSSFNQINPSTKWLKVRAKQFKTTEKNYVTSIQRVKIKKLDDYIQKNNIDKVDLLKIDTQGYEDKVLKGAEKTIKNKKIKAIVTEIIFDNIYDKHFSFSDIEKFIVPYDFRMVGINLPVNNLFTGLVFDADVYYLNKNYYDL